MTKLLMFAMLPMAVFAQAACSDSTGKLATAIDGADRMTLHEGLPHQHFERELLESERRSKPVRELDGYPFYQAPLALSAEDTKRLAQLLSDPATFQSFSGEKLCGGFHPDFAVEWQKGPRSYRALLCFGCGEAKLFGPGLDERYDLAKLAKSKLEALLGRYRQNRPLSDYFRDRGRR
ncbi:MAG TPA: hypothetical protein VN253_19160 [Kofleriaceae bacterium]|nr:hypothetical protein [Kofleriaceae bacterium]